MRPVRGMQMLLAVASCNVMTAAFQSNGMSNILLQHRHLPMSRMTEVPRHRGLGSLAMQIDPLSRRRCLQVAAAAAPLLLWKGRADAINVDAMSAFGYGSGADATKGGGGILSAPFGQTSKLKDLRPKPIRIPRTFMFLQFAVLLMRSCYNTVDDLDFYPMNQFQKDFFLLRQDEWEKYIKENDVQQGDLTNALYFDFISAAQFASITQSIQGAKQIFEETSGVENEKHVIQRDPKLKDDNLLAPRFFLRSGDKMYDGLLTNFTDDSNYVKPPLPARKKLGTVLYPLPLSLPPLPALLTFRVQIFQNNGYAMKIDVEDAGAADTQAYIQAKGIYESLANKIQDEVGGGGGGYGGGSWGERCIRGAGGRGGGEVLTPLKVPAIDQNWVGRGRRIVVRMQVHNRSLPSLAAPILILPLLPCQLPALLTFRSGAMHSVGAAVAELAGQLLDQRP
eukprot:752751-Hanusia_phi.AAC.2